MPYYFFLSSTNLHQFFAAFGGSGCPSIHVWEEAKSSARAHWHSRSRSRNFRKAVSISFHVDVVVGRRSPSFGVSAGGGEGPSRGIGPVGGALKGSTGDATGMPGLALSASSSPSTHSHKVGGSPKSASFSRSLSSRFSRMTWRAASTVPSRTNPIFMRVKDTSRLILEGLLRNFEHLKQR